MATPFPVDPAERPIRPAPRAWAWAVHAYTASGAVWGMLALQALVEGRLEAALLWLSAATFVDATDGFFARRVRVWEVLPHIDGRKLDDIVDYFTYVIIPVAFMAWTGLLPPSPWIMAAPLVASGFGFSNKAAKTVDDYFLGFPSYWNVVAGYMYLLALPPWVNAAIVLALSGLVFLPWRYIYPSKTRPLKWVTLPLGVLWAAQMVVTFAWSGPLPGWWVWATLVFPAYYVGASLYLHFTEPPSEVEVEVE